MPLSLVRDNQVKRARALLCGGFYRASYPRFGYCLVQSRMPELFIAYSKVQKIISRCFLGDPAVNIWKEDSQVPRACVEGNRVHLVAANPAEVKVLHGAEQPVSPEICYWPTEV